MKINQKFKTHSQQQPLHHLHHHQADANIQIGLLILGAMTETTMSNVIMMVELVVLHMKFLIGMNIVMIVNVLVGYE